MRNELKSRLALTAVCCWALLPVVAASAFAQTPGAASSPAPASATPTPRAGNEAESTPASETAPAATPTSERIADVARIVQDSDLTAEDAEALLKALSVDDALRLVQFAELLKESAKQQLTPLQRAQRALLNPWVLFGFVAQATFMTRFVIQIIASERKKRSYVPVAFWYLSLIGGVMLFTYAASQRDPVFMFGQGLGCIIYSRNLALIYSRKNRLDEKQAKRQERTSRQAAEPQTESP